MVALLCRIGGCALALTGAWLLFPQAVAPPGLLWGTLMLSLLYILLRPLLLLLALPFNLLLLGLVTPLADALLIRWTAAWVEGIALSYWQCVPLALAISLLYWPYSCYKKRKLRRARPRAA